MTSFDDLPQELRSHIMYLRAHASYKKEMRRANWWGVRYENGYKYTWKARVLKDFCRSYGLRVSGTKSDLVFRIRDHKRSGLEQKQKASCRFWRSR